VVFCLLSVRTPIESLFDEKSAAFFHEKIEEGGREEDSWTLVPPGPLLFASVLTSGLLVKGEKGQGYGGGRRGGGVGRKIST